MSPTKKLFFQVTTEPSVRRTVTGPPKLKIGQLPRSGIILTLRTLPSLLDAHTQETNGLIGKRRCRNPEIKKGVSHKGLETQY